MDKVHKFVEWDVQPLETFKDEFIYKMREKLNNGGRLTRNEKNELSEYIDRSVYCCRGGYAFWFGDVVKAYVVKQYGSWYERYACDKTSLRRSIFGKIDKILEVK